MKKFFYITVLSLLTSLSAFAQGKPSFGFKVGLNLVNIDSVEDFSLGNTFNENGTTGYHLGLAVFIPLKDKIGLQTEAFYSAEGIEDIDLKYVNMPIMFAYKILPGLRLHLGPQFKVKVDADVSINDGITAEADNRAVEEDFKDFNFDAAAGLEFRLPVIGIFIQGRTVFGLNDIGKEEFFGKSQSIQLSVGYRF